MAASAIGQILGLVGTGLGLAQQFMPYEQGSASLLNPAQQIYQAQMIAAMSPYLKPYYKELNEIAQNPKSSYEGLPSLATEVYGKNGIASQGRVRGAYSAAGDQMSQGASGKLKSRMMEIANVGRGTLRQSLYNRDLQMKQASLDDMRGRQLQALSGMTGNWNTPLIQNRENYMIPGMDPVELIAGAGAGIRGIANMVGNFSSPANSVGSYSHGGVDF